MKTLKEMYQEEFKGKTIIETTRGWEFCDALYAGVPIVITPECLCKLNILLGILENKLKESSTLIVGSQDYCNYREIVEKFGKKWISIPRDYYQFGGIDKERARELNRRKREIDYEFKKANEKGKQKFFQDLVDSLSIINL